MQTLKFKLKGLSPLLMHAFTGDENSNKNDSPQQQAEHHAYRSSTGTGTLVIPQNVFTGALIAGATNTLVGGKGKKTYQKVIASAVVLEDVELDLGVKDFAVYSVPVVIKATGGRIMRHRAKIDSWSAEGTLAFDEKQITKEVLQKVLLDTGAFIGLMDWRPAKKGPFGRFTVEF